MMNTSFHVVLGVDWGTKHVGLALGFLDDHITTHCGTIQFVSFDDCVDRLQKVVSEHDVDVVVLGFPQWSHDKRMIARVRDFGDRLAKALSLPVFYWNEMMTSKEAQKNLHSGVFPSGADVHQESARIMIQDWIDHGNV
ncbi:MAG: Holliday junction resolvase RuvX [Candidatus Moranbacteria bacterium]|nr:Holliday junction resolvase RuvX [Candidatus Moranbacteria bacterium]